MYLQQADLGGDHQDVRVAVVLHGEQVVFSGRVGAELEGSAGSPDVAFVRDVAELVKLPVVFGNIVPLGTSERLIEDRKLMKGVESGAEGREIKRSSFQNSMEDS